ncbi:MAG TPA: alpha/beta hydrolase [Terriglobales bacterium]|nr:alpha/beta hydrolase [Terriglobales bacterium]
MKSRCGVGFLFLVFACLPLFGQSPNRAARPDSAQLNSDTGAVLWIALNYVFIPNITYTTANNYQAKLDVYRPVYTKSPVPIVVNIHGGGWVNGTKEEVSLSVLPYMQMGFAVVNVEYRLARISPAPAAVQDCLCALHWVGRNAKVFGFDLNKVIVTGASAGGHLALTSALIPTTAGFEDQCANDDDASGGAVPWPNHRPRVAAVINWFGITDVKDLLHGPHTRAYAVTWLNNAPDKDDLAARLSPINYVRQGTPPILTIHGDRDTFVPYDQAINFHKALDAVKTRNHLLTINGKGHGDFTLAQNLEAWNAIGLFLKTAGISSINEVESHSRH